MKWSSGVCNELGSLFLDFITGTWIITLTSWILMFMDSTRLHSRQPDEYCNMLQEMCT